MKQSIDLNELIVYNNTVVILTMFHVLQATEAIMSDELISAQQIHDMLKSASDGPGAFSQLFCEPLVYPSALHDMATKETFLAVSKLIRAFISTPDGPRLVELDLAMTGSDSGAKTLVFSNSNSEFGRSLIALIQAFNDTRRYPAEKVIFTEFLASALYSKKGNHKGVEAYIYTMTVTPKSLIIGGRTLWEKN